MNEKLVEQVARALAVADRIQICSDASYAQSSYRSKSQAAIAAHSAFIREAAARDDVVEAGLTARHYDNSFKTGGLTSYEKEEIMPLAFRAMLDQIERTPDEG